MTVKPLIISPLITFLIQSQIWISACALSLYYAASVLGGRTPDWIYGLLLSGGTLITYNVHSWKKTSYSTLYKTIGLSLGIILFILAVRYIRLVHILHILPGMLLAVNYISWRKLHLGSFRRHAFLKPLSIALAWAWLVAGPGEYKDSPYLLSCLYVFLITSNIAILFDLKDIEQDKATKIRTLPQVYTESLIKKVAGFALIIALTPLFILHFAYSLPGFLVIAHIKVIIVHFILTQWITSAKPEPGFYIYLDGIMLLYGIIPGLYMWLY